MGKIECSTKMSNISREEKQADFNYEKVRHVSQSFVLILPPKNVKAFLNKSVSTSIIHRM
jgi:hypothetical protein